jgi:hypothetical protein
MINKIIIIEIFLCLIELAYLKPLSARDRGYDNRDTVYNRTPASNKNSNAKYRKYELAPPEYSDDVRYSNHETRYLSQEEMHPKVYAVDRREPSSVYGKMYAKSRKYEPIKRYESNHPTPYYNHGQEGEYAQEPPVYGKSAKNKKYNKDRHSVTYVIKGHPEESTYGEHNKDNYSSYGSGSKMIINVDVPIKIKNKSYTNVKARFPQRPNFNVMMPMPIPMPMPVGVGGGPIPGPIPGGPVPAPAGPGHASAGGYSSGSGSSSSYG